MKCTLPTQQNVIVKLYPVINICPRICTKNSSVYPCFVDSAISLSLGKNPPKEGTCILPMSLTLSVYKKWPKQIRKSQTHGLQLAQYTDWIKWMQYAQQTYCNTPFKTLQWPTFLRVQIQEVGHYESCYSKGIIILQETDCHYFDCWSAHR